MKKFLLWLPAVLLFTACASDDPVSPPADDFPGNIDEPADPPAQSTVTPCEGGRANGYPCDGIDLIAQLNLDVFDASSANDIWGWTDPGSGKEYALLGLDNGTAFVDISADPPAYLGKLPTHSTDSPWRDVKVSGNYAYIVAEAQNHGMQVFDLTRLRNPGSAPITFTEDAHFDGVGNAHNLVVDPAMARAYIVGTSRDDQFSGGVHVIDISNPMQPFLLGGYGNEGYTHDAQVVTYTGPDTDHQGKVILIGSNETQVVIADLTDPAAPQTISVFDYPNLGYTHQGWFTGDMRYFLLGDETDELQFGFGSRTLVFDLQDLDQPVLSFTYTGPTNAIDHNGYVNGSTFYLANYTAGLRIISLQQIGQGSLEEKAFFDTYPADDDAAFRGLWSVYPYFQSGKIILGDINSGLFVLSESP